MFVDGVADGAVREIEVDEDGKPPEMVAVGGGGKLFIGASNEAAAVAVHVYQRVSNDDPYGPRWLYELALATQ